MNWRVSPPLWMNFLRNAWLAARATPERALAGRLEALEAHLGAEQPDLLELLPIVRAFDRVLADLGLLAPGDSLACRIAWWPSVSVLGLYSAGKSSFINHLLGVDLQSSGNQAVDDLFTVICHGSGSLTLPGSAVNADMRFPFFRIADELDRAVADEGRHIDSYLQLKACTSPRLKGRILIDSPGFDAGDQRRATLRIIEHIVDVSDLVLVFFDARRPEPGAMQDMLHHLVEPAARRTDAAKLLYILNHCDSTAREDNLDEVVGAWRRCLSQAGLTQGRFFCLYNPDLASEIADPAVRERYQSRCGQDLAAIHQRIAAVDSGRGYRLLGQLEALTRDLEHKAMPQLDAAFARWRREALSGGWHWWRGAARREIAQDLPEQLDTTLRLGLRAAFLAGSAGASTLLRGRPHRWARARKALPLLRQAILHQTQLWNTRHAGLTMPAPAPATRKTATVTAVVEKPRAPAAKRRNAEKASATPSPAPPRSGADSVSPLLQAESLLSVASGLLTLGGRLAPRCRSSRAAQAREEDDEFLED